VFITKRPKLMAVPVMARINVIARPDMLVWSKTSDRGLAGPATWLWRTPAFHGPDTLKFDPKDWMSQTFHG